MSKHTPGPWHVEERGLYVRDRVWVSAGDVRVAQVDQEYYGAEPVGTSRGNARLIAAAPELLEALRPFAFYAEQWLADDTVPEDAAIAIVCRKSELRAAAAAIAAAEGEP